MCILNLEEELCTGCKIIYCRKSISINTYSSCLHQIIMFLIKKSKYVTDFSVDFSVAYFIVVFLLIYVKI